MRLYALLLIASSCVWSTVVYVRLDSTNQSLAAIPSDLINQCARGCEKTVGCSGFSIVSLQCSLLSSPLPSSPSDISFVRTMPTAAFCPAGSKHFATFGQIHPSSQSNSVSSLASSTSSIGGQTSASSLTPVTGVTHETGSQTSSSSTIAGVLTTPPLSSSTGVTGARVMTTVHSNEGETSKVSGSSSGTIEPSTTSIPTLDKTTSTAGSTATSTRTTLSAPVESTSTVTMPTYLPSTTLSTSTTSSLPEISTTSSTSSAPSSTSTSSATTTTLSTSTTTTSIPTSPSASTNTLTPTSTSTVTSEPATSPSSTSTATSSVASSTTTTEPSTTASTSTSSTISTTPLTTISTSSSSSTQSTITTTTEPTPSTSTAITTTIPSKTSTSPSSTTTELLTSTSTTTIASTTVPTTSMSTSTVTSSTSTPSTSTLTSTTTTTSPTTTEYNILEKFKFVDVPGSNVSCYYEKRSLGRFSTNGLCALEGSDPCKAQGLVSVFGSCAGKSALKVADFQCASTLCYMSTICVPWEAMFADKVNPTANGNFSNKPSCQSYTGLADGGGICAPNIFGGKMMTGRFTDNLLGFAAGGARIMISACRSSDNTLQASYCPVHPGYPNSNCAQSLGNIGWIRTGTIPCEGNGNFQNMGAAPCANHSMLISGSGGSRCIGWDSGATTTPFNRSLITDSSWFVWNGTLPKALYDGSVMGRLLEYKEYMVLPRVLISPL